MPEFLIKFINQLTTEQADSLWLWLDGEPNAIQEMIEKICDKHPEIVS